MVATLTESSPSAASTTNAGQLIDVHKLSPENAVQRLIEHAVSIRASDLFLVSNEQHVAIQVRHLGVIRTISILPPDLGKRCMAHIRASAGIDASDRRKPADGRWIYEPSSDEVATDTVDLRINIMPTTHGEDFAIRLLVRDPGMFSLENIGMTRQQYDDYTNMITSPSGLILIAGPTGSGKTATLYASLLRLNDGKRKINTIEDPVEYMIDGLRQSQINPTIHLGFSDLLRSVLRQSPDVIMVGEIRDAETAQIAAHAANSGTLVFATIHSATAPGVVQAMRSLGIHSHFLGTALRGVVAQRLVRTFCPKCLQSFDISESPHTFDEVRPWLSDDQGKTLFASRGCEACNNAGYSGRTGVFEIMSASKTLRSLISEGAPTANIRTKAIEEGMLQFRQSALLKVAQGQTSTEEVFRVIPSEHLMLDEQ